MVFILNVLVGIIMAEDEIINFDDINYAIYKIGSWKNNYEINQIGLSSEVPVTELTVKHVKLTMEEIRKSQFNISDKDVNGFVAIAYHLNPKIQEMDLEDVIKLEEDEYENILKELDELDILSEGSTPLETEDYLIYKLEKDCHVVNSIPANKYTKKFYYEEMKRIDDSVIN